MGRLLEEMRNDSSSAQNTMLTEVILEGELGKEFGREWNLCVSSPAEAMRLINANDRRFAPWIRDNLDKFAAYRIVCENESGLVEELTQETFGNHRKMRRITFYPLDAGAGGHTNWTQVLEGVAMLVAAYFTYGASTSYFAAGSAGASMTAGAASAMAGIGASMILQGFIVGLTPQPSSNNQNSFYFNGPVNTVAQGNPVPIVYGTMLTGSQAISVSLSVDQMMSSASSASSGTTSGTVA